MTCDSRPPLDWPRCPRPGPGGASGGGQQKVEPSQPQQPNGALKVSVWSKVLRSDTAWEDKDEFLDVTYWF